MGGAGDVNGDGLSDLIVGARDAAYDNPHFGDPEGNPGAAYLVFGKASTASVNLGALGSSGFLIKGPSVGGEAGWSVAGAGDVNGDGLADLIIGSPYGDRGGRTDAGSSFVVFGKSDLSTIDLAQLGSRGFVIRGAGVSDRSGTAVAAAGDVNGDGLDDLIVGAPFAQPGGNSQAGASYVIFGKADVNPVELSVVASGNGGFAAFGQHPNESVGYDVGGAGDVNGDGLSDVIVGAPFVLVNAFTGIVGLSTVTFAPGRTTGTLGTAGANKLSGTIGPDTILGNGGDDVLLGGAGDDLISITDAQFARIDGGSGFNTLRLDTPRDFALDLTTIADDRLRNMDQTDLSGAVADILTLNAREVLNLSGRSNTLTVKGTALTSVFMGGVWTQGADVILAGLRYQTFTQGRATLRLGGLTLPKLLDVSSTLNDGSYSVGQQVPITVTFDATVFVTGTPLLTAETGLHDAAASYSGGSGTSSLTFLFTVGAGYTSPRLNLIGSPLSLNGGSILDAAGNVVFFTIPAPGSGHALPDHKAIVIDTTAPTAQLASVVPNPRTNGLSSIAATFSEAVSGLGIGAFTLARTDANNVQTTIDVSRVGLTSIGTTGSGFSLGDGQSAGDLASLTSTAGTYLLTLNANSARDAAGNLLALAATAVWQVVLQQTSLTVGTSSTAPVTYGGTTSLTATLTAAGQPLVGQVVQFTLNGLSTGAAITDGTGVATLAGVSVGNLGAGAHPSAINASFSPSGTMAGSTASASLTIVKAHLTVKADDLNTLYGQPVPTLTSTITGFLLGEDAITAHLVGTPTLSTAATAAGSVAGGPYAITAGVGTLSAANYDFTAAAGSLAVARAHLTVTAANRDIAHGDAIPSLGYSLSGLMPGDPITLVRGAPALGTQGTSGAAGSYPITAGIGTLTADNYDFPTLTPARLTVHPKVVDVRVHWGSMSMSLLGLNRDLPFSNITAIDVLFSDDVDATSSSLSLRSTLAAATSYSLSTFSYNPSTRDATWTLPSALGIDRLMTALGSAHIASRGDATNTLYGATSWGFAVLPGDYNGDMAVSSADMAGVNNATVGPFILLADLNGDGKVDSNEVLIARGKIGTKLPPA